MSTAWSLPLRESIRFRCEGEVLVSAHRNELAPELVHDLDNVTRSQTHAATPTADEKVG